MPASRRCTTGEQRKTLDGIVKANSALVIIAALGVTLGAGAGAEAQVSARSELLGGKVFLDFKQTGDARCMFDLKLIKQAAIRGIERYCELEIVDSPEEKSRMLFELDWAMSEIPESSVRVDICSSPLIIEFNLRQPAKDYDPSREYPDTYFINTRLYRNHDSVQHQMDRATVKWVQDSVLVATEGAAELFCTRPGGT